MQRHDWAGTVLVGCLLASAGLLRDHTILLVLLALVAVMCIAVIVWDVRTRKPVEPSEALRAWLDERIDEIQGIKKQFRALLARSIPSYDEMQATLDTFWGINDDVIRRLHQDAPEAIGAYTRNPDWYDMTLTRSSREECEEVIKLFDYAIDQLAHIRAHLEPLS